MPAVGPAGGRSRARSRRLSSALLRAVYAGVALLALPLLTPGALLLALALGLSATAFAALLFHVCQEPLPARTALVRTAWAAAGFVPFAEGVRVLQGLGTVLGLVVLGLLVAVSHQWVAGLEAVGATDRRSPGPPGAGRCGSEAPDLAGLLRVLPVDLLLDEWRRLNHVPRSGPPDRRVADARDLVLAELRRRDPAGERWSTGGAALPQPPLRDDHPT